MRYLIFLFFFMPAAGMNQLQIKKQQLDMSTQSSFLICLYCDIIESNDNTLTFPCYTGLREFGHRTHTLPETDAQKIIDASRSFLKNGTTEMHCIQQSAWALGRLQATYQSTFAIPFQGNTQELLRQYRAHAFMVGTLEDILDACNPAHKALTIDSQKRIALRLAALKNQPISQQ